MAQRRARGGFTLVELLVVITIIGMLMAMLFPAMSGVMNQVHSTRCQSQLRQVGTAVKTYYSTNQAFPCGVTVCSKPEKQWMVGGSRSGNICQGPNWLVSILGQLGEGPMYTNVTDCMKSPDCGVVSEKMIKWGGVGSTTPRILLCPSANQATELFDNSELGLQELAKANYAGNFGAGTYLDAINTTDKDPKKNAAKVKLRGPFFVVQRDKPNFSNLKATSANDPNVQGGFKAGGKYGLTKVSDGESRTILVSEVTTWDNASDGRGVWASAIMGGSIFTAKTLPNADPKGNNGQDADRTQACDEKSIPQLDPSKLYCKPARDKATGAYAAARSTHIGGVNVLFCGGNLDFVADTVDLSVWQAMATANGGEPTQ